MITTVIAISLCLLVAALVLGPLPDWIVDRLDSRYQRLAQCQRFAQTMVVHHHVAYTAPTIMRGRCRWARSFSHPCVYSTCRLGCPDYSPRGTELGGFQ
jgi:hypothetical protein